MRDNVITKALYSPISITGKYISTLNPEIVVGNAELLVFHTLLFRVLKIVEDSTLYHAVEEAIPHDKKYRVGGGYPKDSFHVACGSHKTRLENILRSPGIDPIEKSLLKQRLINLPAAKNGYIEKQKKALAN